MAMPDNLVNVSCREDMSVSDRIDLMRAELMQPPFAGVTEATIAATQAIHDVKLTICRIRGTIALYDAAVARGETEERLARGANLMLSPVECLILAWKRGGHREYLRVRGAQRRICP
jgi:hypothetical protein